MGLKIAVVMVFPLTENDAIFKYQKRLRKTEYYLNTGKNGCII